MPFKVIGEGKHGDVIFRREEADGTVVLLVCEEFASLDEATGPVIAPEPDDKDPEQGADESAPGGNRVFPLCERAASLRAASDEPLVVDISEMPKGMLLFTPGQFTREAIASLEAGKTCVVLNEQSAREFGFTSVLSYLEVLEP